MDRGGSNTTRRAYIETIVREVLAEMSVRPRANSTDVPARAVSTGELRVTNKVISVQTLEGRLEGVARLIVPRGAVFTPAVRDELRKRNVAVASAVVAQPEDIRRKLVLGIAETKFEPAVLIDICSTDAVTFERLPHMGLIRVVDEICQEVVRGGKLGVLLTGQTAAALCLANRLRGVRAALGGSVQAVNDAVKSVAANLLVIEPSGRSLFELQQMIRAWTCGGTRSCPAELRDRLG